MSAPVPHLRAVGHGMGGLGTAGLGSGGSGAASYPIRVPTGNGLYTCPSIPTPNANPRSFAIDKVTGRMFVSDLTLDRIYEVDPATGASLGFFAAPNASSYVQDMDVDDTTGNLIVLNIDQTVYILDKDTGAQLPGQFSITSNYTRGISVKDGNLITLGNPDATFRFHSGLADNVVSSATIDTALMDGDDTFSVDATGQFLLVCPNYNGIHSVSYLNIADASFAGGFDVASPIPNCVACDGDGNIFAMRASSDIIYKTVMEDGLVMDGQLFAPHPNKFENGAAFT